ncbi:MAG: hypothetical protein IPK50_09500 [Fibrobacterota bacterium]|nr:hypothetical protein [Fibrobacterota bacterium]QQS07113.1 MAG: hypothetical protein IPK50_09500 [Fibrobacterota bacterium]
MKRKSIFAPDINYISEAERMLSVSYPVAFKEFCKENHETNILNEYPNLSNGKFIANLCELKTINSRIGNDQWRDYEQAIAGKTHQKDGMKLWGDILPIYIYDDKNVSGFNFNDPNDIRIYVWSVHCLVHDYSDLYDWLKHA